MRRGAHSGIRSCGESSGAASSGCNCHEFEAVIYTYCRIFRDRKRRSIKQNRQEKMALTDAGDTSLLLGNTDAPPVIEQNPQSTSPFLLTSDHFGRAIPQRLGDHGLPESELSRHIAWDIGIAGVARGLSERLNA